jgi:putative membrane protein
MEWMTVELNSLMPTVSTFFIVLSATLVAIGWRLAIKRRLDQHQKVMVYAAVAAVLFFIIYASRTFIIGSTPYNGPDGLKPYYLVFLLFHIVLATVAAVFGISTIVLGYKKKFAKHRKFGRFTSIIWFITAITGTAVYSILYVLYPAADAKPLFEAIFG